jgi:hypothetical protein
LHRATAALPAAVVKLGTSASPLTPLFARESLKLSSQEKQKASSRVEMKIETGALICCKFFATHRSDASVHD